LVLKLEPTGSLALPCLSSVS